MEVFIAAAIGVFFGLYLVFESLKNKKDYEILRTLRSIEELLKKMEKK